MLCPRTGIRIPKDPRPDNRRRHGRVRVGDISCDLGPILDISASGMNVKIGFRGMRIGSKVSFVIDGPDGHFAVKAVVVRCTRLGWLAHEVGLQFIENSPAVANNLAQIARLSAMRGDGLSSNEAA